MKRKGVLFVTYGGGHVNMIVPAAQALLDRKDFEIIAQWGLKQNPWVCSKVS